MWEIDVQWQNTFIGSFKGKGEVANRIEQMLHGNVLEQYGQHHCLRIPSFACAKGALGNHFILHGYGDDYQFVQD